jgi:hypothetical protein
MGSIFFVSSAWKFLNMEIWTRFPSNHSPAEPIKKAAHRRRRGFTVLTISQQNYMMLFLNNEIKLYNVIDVFTYGIYNIVIFVFIFCHYIGQILPNTLLCQFSVSHFINFSRFLLILLYLLTLQKLKFVPKFVLCEFVVCKLQRGHTSGEGERLYRE